MDTYVDRPGGEDHLDENCSYKRAPWDLSKGKNETQCIYSWDGKESWATKNKKTEKR